MLEVDEDSRLGREMLGTENGTGSRASMGRMTVPAEDEIAEWYARGVRMAGGGRGEAVRDFELCARRVGVAAQHEVLAAGAVCGVWAGCAFDAADEGRARCGGRMRMSCEGIEVQGRGSRFKAAGVGAVRRGRRPEIEVIGREKAFEEAMFLGLRMNEGVDMEALRAEFGEELVGGRWRRWGMWWRLGWWCVKGVGCG